MIIWSTAPERENYKQINEYKQRLIDKELHLEQMEKKKNPASFFMASNLPGSFWSVLNVLARRWEPRTEGIHPHDNFI